jgi:V8-like Glu-specific endopeptidase
MIPAAVAVAALATAVGCAPKTKAPPVRAASNAGDVPHEVLFSPQIALATPEDAVVRILTPQMSCTGTLVDDDLVLTSHHCVVERGARGEFTTKVLRGRDFRIELGGDYLPWGSVTVKAVVAPPCGESGGGGDVAILVLSRKLVGMPTMTPRLDEPPKIGEAIDPIGFGRCATSADGIRRHVRAGGPINALSGETLHVVASICPGDSGGPVVLRGSRQIVGVISLSAMDGDEKTSAPSIMARLDAFRSVFNHARLIADGLSQAELPPIECK